MSRSPAELRSPWLIRAFSWWALRMLRRQFHAVRLLDHGADPRLPEGPLVVALNHASWWDPLVGLVMARRFPDRIAYTPIDAEQLRRYRFFARMGFFGVERGSRSAAPDFLRTASELLERPGSSIWITPQGSFADVRRRPLRLERGVGHLAHQMKDGAVLPIAVEYCFWDERLAEVLVAVGDPVLVDSGSELDAPSWTDRIGTSLATAQDRLSEAAIARDPGAFTTILGGTEGVGGPYGLWLRLRAALRGRRYLAAHNPRAALDEPAKEQG